MFTNLFMFPFMCFLPINPADHRVAVLARLLHDDTLVSQRKATIKPSQNGGRLVRNVLILEHYTTLAYTTHYTCSENILRKKEAM